MDTPKARPTVIGATAPTADPEDPEDPEDRADVNSDRTTVSHGRGLRRPPLSTPRR